MGLTVETWVHVGYFVGGINVGYAMGWGLQYWARIRARRRMRSRGHPQPTMPIPRMVCRTCEGGYGVLHAESCTAANGRILFTTHDGQLCHQEVPPLRELM